ENAVTSTGYIHLPLHLREVVRLVLQVQKLARVVNVAPAVRAFYLYQTIITQVAVWARAGPSAEALKERGLHIHACVKLIERPRLLFHRGTVLGRNVARELALRAMVLTHHRAQHVLSGAVRVDSQDRPHLAGGHPALSGREPLG